MKQGLGAQRGPSGSGLDWQAGEGTVRGRPAQMTIVGLGCYSGGAYQMYFCVSFSKLEMISHPLV